jgi:hypothetical protein
LSKCRDYSRRQQFEEIEREALGKLNTSTGSVTIALLVNSEWDDRKNRNIDRALKLATFRYKASTVAEPSRSMEQVDYSVARGLDKNHISTGSITDSTGWLISTSSKNAKTCLLPEAPVQERVI